MKAKHPVLIAKPELAGISLRGHDSLATMRGVGSLRAPDLMHARVDYEREPCHPDAEKHAARVAGLRARLPTCGPSGRGEAEREVPASAAAAEPEAAAPGPKRPMPQNQSQLSPCPLRSLRSLRSNRVGGARRPTPAAAGRSPRRLDRHLRSGRRLCRPVLGWGFITSSNCYPVRTNTT